MAAIIRGILRDTVEWEKEPNFETLIPKRTNGLHLNEVRFVELYAKGVVRDFVLKLQKGKS